jgi:hypothetical protein
LPVDYAGKGIAEVVLASHPAKSAIVYHIVNPNVSASWDDILAGLRTAGLEFETVDRTQWVERLSKSDPDGQKNPTIKLLVSSFPLLLRIAHTRSPQQPFFQMRYGKAHRQPMVFSTEATAKAAPSIGDSPPISPDLVAKWVLHWRETGFLI